MKTAKTNGKVTPTVSDLQRKNATNSLRDALHVMEMAGQVSQRLFKTSFEFREQGIPYSPADLVRIIDESRLALNALHEHAGDMIESALSDLGVKEAAA